MAELISFGSHLSLLFLLNYIISLSSLSPFFVGAKKSVYDNYIFFFFAILQSAFICQQVFSF